MSLEVRALPAVPNPIEPWEWINDETAAEARRLWERNRNASQFECAFIAAWRAIEPLCAKLKSATPSDGEGLRELREDEVDVLAGALGEALHADGCGIPPQALRNAVRALWPMLKAKLSRVRELPAGETGTGVAESRACGRCGTTVSEIWWHGAGPTPRCTDCYRREPSQHLWHPIMASRLSPAGESAEGPEPSAQSWAFAKAIDGAVLRAIEAGTPPDKIITAVDAAREAYVAAHEFDLPEPGEEVRDGD